MGFVSAPPGSITSWAPRIIHWLKKGISLSKAEFCTWICVRTAPPFLLSPLALEIFPTSDPG